MHSFGQEFYPLESIRALQLVAKKRLSERAAIIDAISASLPQPSEKTRRRIASKIVQRYISGRRKIIDPPPHQQPFVRLLTKHPHAPAQIELLYYQLCQTDTLVGALARDLFYPTGIERRAPQGMSASEFAVANGSLLPEVAPHAPPLTRAFIIKYARSQWRFGDASSVDRALRVLTGAGLISHERMAALRGYPSAFRVADHDVSLTAFLWAMHCEFLSPNGRREYSLSQQAANTSLFARTLLLNPQQVEENVEAARQRQLLAGRGDEIRLLFHSLDALADALLGHNR